MKRAVRIARLAYYMSTYRIRRRFSIRNRVERKRNVELLAKARAARNNEPHSKRPHISVLIPTYNRAELLFERTIPSVLRQTYQNFELIIVGDHCTDDTEKRIGELGSDKIRFVNLPERGIYPEEPMHRWMVAGASPGNKAIELASGEWIAPLDDDDEFSDDHLEVLLEEAVERGHEMVYAKVNMEVSPGSWKEVGSYPLMPRGEISRMSSLYRADLSFFKYDVNSWKYREPGDWNMWRRMTEAGVRIGFLDRVVGNHYLEGSQTREPG